MLFGGVFNLLESFDIGLHLLMGFKLKQIGFRLFDENYIYVINTSAFIGFVGRKVHDRPLPNIFDNFLVSFKPL